jgi:fatty acid desaturase
MPILPRDAKLDFLRRQVLMSRNISGGRWMSFLTGGLSLQTEHHLFPSMPSPNLRKIQPMVKQFCADHNVHYTETTLFQSYGIVVRYLNRVGLAARDPFDCPIASQLR